MVSWISNPASGLNGLIAAAGRYPLDFARRELLFPFDDDICSGTASKKIEVVAKSQLQELGLGSVAFGPKQ